MQLFKDRIKTEKLGKYYQKITTYNWLGIETDYEVTFQEGTEININNVLDMFAEMKQYKLLFHMSTIQLILKLILEIILEKSELKNNHDN